jgi:nucleotidyltransferase substrate binding protein (TIGR01987 family)
MAADRVGQLERALARLEEALARPVDPIVRDACIQRFEFTFEAAWKAIQARALLDGVECVSPRDCLRAAFRLRLVDDDARWMRMVDDRNRTTHTYNETVAQSIYHALGDYASLLGDLLARLKGEK